MHTKRTRRVRPEDGAAARVVLGFAAVVALAVLVVKPVMEGWVFPMVEAGGPAVRVLWVLGVVAVGLALVRLGWGEGR